MPELPEVEVVRCFLESHVVGKKIQKVSIVNEKLRYKIPSNLNLSLRNMIITKILRRGKYLILLFKSSKLNLLIHLGMTGYFRLSQKLKKKNHDHLIFFLGKKILIYNDIRKFGFVKTYSDQEIFNSSHLKYMGVEPLSGNFNLNYFNSVRKRTGDLKGLLMNQSFVAGLGNIYCSEILYDARVSPLRKVNSLNDFEIESIIKSTKKILKKSISFGGTTIKNFIVSEEKIGYFKNKLKVYSRDKKNCMRCLKGIVIKKIKQSGRSTFFCEKCQK
tara:strand:- start:731 stop:1552 length:822 start_codon:yes stop_codon:yes gene_type:complete